VRAEPDKLKTRIVRLAIDQDQVGLDVATVIDLFVWILGEALPRGGANDLFDGLRRRVARA
jgi:hypothetical protein